MGIRIAKTHLYIDNSGEIGIRNSKTHLYIDTGGNVAMLLSKTHMYIDNGVDDFKRRRNFMNFCP